MNRSRTSQLARRLCRVPTAVRTSRLRIVVSVSLCCEGLNMTALSSRPQIGLEIRGSQGQTRWLLVVRTKHGLLSMWSVVVAKIYLLESCRYRCLPTWLACTQMSSRLHRSKPPSRPDPHTETPLSSLTGLFNPDFGIRKGDKTKRVSEPEGDRFI